MMIIINTSMALAKALSISSQMSYTGESHLYHRAHWHEGKLYYRGKVLIDSTTETA